MLTRLWTIGVKVSNLERELEFHRAMGNEIVLDEMVEFEGAKYRIPLVKMGDRYLHLTENLVYEKTLGEIRPVDSTHMVYISNNFDNDAARALQAGAVELAPVSHVSGGFGERRIAFMCASGGWIFELIHVISNLVPEV